MRRPRAEVRFNLEKEEDRKAWELLQSSKQSRSRLIIAALNSYAEMQDEQARQSAFFERVIETIQRELKCNVISAAVQPEAPLSNTDEDAMDAFLDSFQ